MPARRRGVPDSSNSSTTIRTMLIRIDSARGEHLPPARELAAALDVNMHTVLRAYAALRDEGLVEMRRGRGVTVASTGAHRARVVELARAFLLEARRQSMGFKEIKRLLEE